ncbi:MAG: DNA-processing protein DprA, partial [Psychrobium sp.]
IYPKSHTTLAREIANSGLLLSEFWPEITPKAVQFPRRNRIVSGLSLGVVVVEAADKSGSLITARLATEQNREVFAVPGSINNPKVAGCHKLISQGAKLITGVADILEELSHYTLIRENNVSAEISDDNDQTTLNSPTADDIVLANVGYEVTAVDVIAQRCEMTVEQVLERLLMLELSGRVCAESGGYIRIQGEA